MKPLALVRSALLVLPATVVGAASFGSTAGLTACGETAACSRLRNDTYAQKTMWDACNPTDPNACIEVFGNKKDCTGVLYCDFAVNPHYRAEAEQAVLTIGERSQGCYSCDEPDCVSGEIAWCEPVSRRCIVVTMLTEGGVPLTLGTPPSSGATTNDDAAPSVSGQTDASLGPADATVLPGI
jgi:hypothetical protein